MLFSFVCYLWEVSSHLTVILMQLKKECDNLNDQLKEVKSR